MAPELSAIKARLASQKGPGPGFGADREAYGLHAALEEAFRLAALDGTEASPERGEAGRRVATEARDILLREVLAPYDRLIGQAKKPDTTAPFAAHATDVFTRWLILESGLPPGCSLSSTGSSRWSRRPGRIRRNAGRTRASSGCPSSSPCPPVRPTVRPGSTA